MALNTKKCSTETLNSVFPPFRYGDDADYGGQYQNRCELEWQEIIGEEHLAYALDGAEPFGGRGRRGASGKGFIESHAGKITRKKKNDEQDAHFECHIPGVEPEGFRMQVEKHYGKKE